MKKAAKELDIYIATDQHETCRKCGCRTHFKDVGQRKQKHTCPECGYTYIVEWEDESSAHYELVPARKYYGSHATGWILLRNGSPEHNGSKAEARTLLENVQALTGKKIDINKIMEGK